MTCAADSRRARLRDWLNDTLPGWDGRLESAAGDASSRRYYRAAGRVVMDAPPELNDCRSFMAVAERFRDIGLNVPQVLAADLEQGFLLLSDLGRRHYLDQLTHEPASAGRLYRAAFAALTLIQRDADPADQPPYDEALLRRELGIFSDWLLARQLRAELGDGEQTALQRAFDFLVEAALEQPRLWVHRDYHSRNLMVCDGHTPGILDFQDGLHGPLCYDLVSLLRDCYIAWPAKQVTAWALAYRQRLAEWLDPLPDPATLLRWFDLCGVQRHLKAAGLFARLKLRDGKPQYQAELPRTLGYVIEVAGRYPELDGLQRLLLNRCGPLL